MPNYLLVLWEIARDYVSLPLYAVGVVITFYGSAHFMAEFKKALDQDKIKQMIQAAISTLVVALMGPAIMWVGLWLAPHDDISFVIGIVFGFVLTFWCVFREAKNESKAQPSNS